MKTYLLLLMPFLFSACNRNTPLTPAATNAPAAQPANYLIQYYNDTTGGYGYKNTNGEMVIAAGKYAMCFTDTFKTYAIVVKPQEGIVAINRQENTLYKVYPFDNGPDAVANGLFRIIQNNKIGYADEATGKIVIEPQFDCAYPFEDGVAKVSTKCKTEQTKEHSSWTSSNWEYIDKTGKKTTATESAAE